MLECGLDGPVQKEQDNTNGSDGPTITEADFQRVLMLKPDGFNGRLS